MPTRRQHIIPASYIAQFSPKKENRLRESKVYCYHTRSEKTLNIKSEDFLYEDRYFEVQSSIVNIEEQINLVETQLNDIE